MLSGISVEEAIERIKENAAPLEDDIPKGAVLHSGDKVRVRYI